MDQQYIADRLSSVLGVRVSVGLHRWIEDVRDPNTGAIAGQIVHDEGQKFTGPDGADIQQADVDAAMAWAEENPPPPRPVYVAYDAMRARLSAAERQAILSSADWRVRDFLGLAQAQREINVAGTMAAQAKELLVSLSLFVPAAGQTMQERADEVFAP